MLNIIWKFKGEEELEILSFIKSDIERNISPVEKIYLITDDDSGKCFLGIRLKNSEKDGSVRAKESITKIAEEKLGKECEVFLSPLEEVEFFISKMKDYIASHGGVLKVVNVDESNGVVVVSMEGACAMCPSAVVTMKAGIRRFLSQYLPWVRKVEPAEEPKEPDFGFKLAPPRGQNTEKQKSA